MKRFEKLMRELGAIEESAAEGYDFLVLYVRNHAIIASNDMTLDFSEGCAIELGVYPSSAENNWMSYDSGHGLQIETADDLQALEIISEWIKKDQSGDLDLLNALQ